MPVDQPEIRIVKLTDATTPKLFSDDVFVWDDTNAGGGVRSDDDFPKETVAFDYGNMDGQTFDDFAVDPNNPNVTGQVTFGGSITLQNVRNFDVHTLDDWFHI